MNLFCKVFFIFSTVVSFDCFATITILYREDGGPEKKFEFADSNGDMTVIVNAKAVSGWQQMGLKWIDFGNGSTLVNALYDYLEVRRSFAPDVKQEELVINLELGKAINPYEYEVKENGANQKFVLDGLDVGGDFSAEELAKYSAKRSKFAKSGGLIEQRSGLPIVYFGEITHQFAAALGRHLANHYNAVSAEDVQKLAEKYFSFDVEFGKTYFAAAERCRKLIQNEFAEFMGVFLMHKYAKIGQRAHQTFSEYYAKLFPIFDAVARFNSQHTAYDSAKLIKEYQRRAQSPFALLGENLVGQKLDGFFAYHELRNLSKSSENPADKQKYERAKLSLLATLNADKITNELSKVFVYGDSYSTYSCDGVYFRKNLR